MMEPNDNYIGCKVGDRIRLVAMPDDPDPLPPGSTGTVTSVTEGNMGQLGVDWDNGRSLFLLPGIDQFNVIDDSNLVGEDSACPNCGNQEVDLRAWDANEGDFVTCTLCQTQYFPNGNPLGHTPDDDDHETSPATAEGDPDDEADPT